MRNLLKSLAGQWKLIGGSVLITVLLIFTVQGGERLLSTNTFCLSCHSMSYNNEELKESSHFSALGINPECQDCHLPPQFLLRVESHVVDGIRAIIGELKHDLSTKEAFDEHRAEYAHNARINIRKWDSSPCRRCHRAPDPSSDEAVTEHKRMETEGLTCIDCHQNLVHDYVPEEDLVKGIAEGRIVLKEDEDEEEEEAEPSPIPKP